jgi:cell wall-associated NlpC family hydrolase
MLDCAGLIYRVYDDLGVSLPDFRLYGPEPHRDGLTSYVVAALGEPAHVAPVLASQLQEGDVICLRYEVEPHHMAIVGSHKYGKQLALTMIHADGFNKRVLEQRLTPDVISQITHVYRRPV